mmetsp:Transcript_1498/g.6553  ORF Transcript_1498/g.6553 Transcript_1498/m.6553 type:complete len:283 (-) Transcript_1498:685-1533(-)
MLGTHVLARGWVRGRAHVLRVGLRLGLRLRRLGRRVLRLRLLRGLRRRCRQLLRGLLLRLQVLGLHAGHVRSHGSRWGQVQERCGPLNGRGHHGASSRRGGREAGRRWDSATACRRRRRRLLAVETHQVGRVRWTGRRQVVRRTHLGELVVLGRQALLAHNAAALDHDALLAGLAKQQLEALLALGRVLDVRYKNPSVVAGGRRGRDGPHLAYLSQRQAFVDALEGGGDAAAPDLARARPEDCHFHLQNRRIGVDVHRRPGRPSPVDAALGVHHLRHLRHWI